MKKRLTQKNEQALLTFLKRTKEGKYTEVGRTVLPQERTEDLRDDVYDNVDEDSYYFSTR